MGKTIWQELCRSKAKTIVLGLVCLAGVYFWLPLIGKWMGNSTSDKADALSTVQNEIPTNDVAMQAVAPSAKLNLHRWDQLVEWRRTNELMGAATLEADCRDPFRSIAAALSEPQPVIAMEAEPESQLEIAPADVFTLTSTLIGRRSRLAMIDGQSYGEKSVVTAHSDADKSAAIEFELTEIHPDHIVLTRNERQYTLAVSRGDLANGNHVVVHRRPADN